MWPLLCYGSLAQQFWTVGSRALFPQYASCDICSLMGKACRQTDWAGKVWIKVTLKNSSNRVALLMPYIWIRLSNFVSKRINMLYVFLHCKKPVYICFFSLINLHIVHNDIIVRLQDKKWCNCAIMLVSTQQKKLDGISHQLEGHCTYILMT